MTIPRRAAALAAAITIIAAAAIAPADAQTTEPPPLTEQPAQNTIDHHISPPACTLPTPAVDFGPCIELGQRWRCPIGLSPAAVHRTAPTYAETITPGFDADLLVNRDSHCLFVALESAYPVAPYDAARPLLQCVEVYLNGERSRGDCQTTAAAPTPAATATPAATPAPVQIPVPSFTG